MSKTLTIAPTFGATSEEIIISGSTQKLYCSIPSILKDQVPKAVRLKLFAGGIKGRTSQHTTELGYTKSEAIQNLSKATMGINIFDIVDLGIKELDSKNVPGVLDGEVKMSNGLYLASGEAVYAGREQILFTFNDSQKAFSQIVNSGYLFVVCSYHCLFIYAETEKSLNPPSLEIDFDEGVPESTGIAPLGFVNESEAVTFSWRTSWSGYPIEDIEQTSATLEWISADDGITHAVSISGAATSYVMPADTLPESSSISWRVTTITDSGTAVSPWRTISTTDAIPVVTAVSPSGVYIDNTVSSRFMWTYNIETGTDQKRYELQIKRGDTDWILVQAMDSSEQYADIPAGYLLSGETQWRVRAFNSDYEPSAWSDPKTCIVVAVPSTPQVTVTDAVPRASIKWTAADQQAYQVKMGNYDSGIIYGVEKTFKCPEFLSNGWTDFNVRVMNSFGYWSKYGSAAALIENVPSTETITLDVSPGIDAILSWNSISDAKEYVIFRDGERIAEVKDTSYKDKIAIGTHSYLIYASMSDDRYYTPSQRVSATLSVPYPMISTLDGEWMSLELSISSVPEASADISRDLYLMQYDGYDYPLPEIGTFKNRTYTISVAFESREEADAFENMIGKIVILKNQYDDLIVGIMGSMSKTQNTFWIHYSSTITEVDKSQYEKY